jgi:hypothetical protein
MTDLAVFAEERGIDVIRSGPTHEVWQEAGSPKVRW